MVQSSSSDPLGHQLFRWSHRVVIDNEIPKMAMALITYSTTVSEIRVVDMTLVPQYHDISQFPY